MPDVGVQVPPNLSDWWPELVEAGATDLGGLSANGDHISPEEPFPSPHQVRKQLAPQGLRADRAPLRLPAVHGPGVDGAGRARRDQAQVLELHPAAGLRAAGRGASIDAGPAPAGDRARAREGEELSEDELTALFAETRPEVIEEMRAAADELRAELAGDRVTFVVNRNINFTNVCVVGCAFCGFGQGKRSPDAYQVSEEDFAARIHEAVDFGATEICMQGGIHPDYTLEDYGRWLRLAKQVAPQLHLHAYSPMEIHYMCERSGKAPDEVFEYLIDCGLGSTPGTAAEVLDDGVRQRISPNKLPVDRWVEIIEASHRAGLRSTSTVMFGHIEEPRELARHMRVVRELQERTGGITEFVPLSFIPFNTMLGRTHGVEEISRDGEPQAHRGVPAGARQDDPQPPGELGEDGPRRRDREPALGRQRPRRHADGGEHLAHGRLPARRPARARAADRGARAAGRVPAQRTTLYEIVETYEARPP